MRIIIVLQNHCLSSKYRRVRRLHPSLQDFSVTSAYQCSPDSLATQLRLTAELLPQSRHIVIQMGMPHGGDWYPDPVIAEFLAQLTSIDFYYISRELNRILKHCRMLTQLKAPNADYSRPGPPVSSVATASRPISLVLVLFMAMPTPPCFRSGFTQSLDSQARGRHVPVRCARVPEPGTTISPLAHVEG